MALTDKERQAILQGFGRPPISCRRCGRELKEPISKARGIGPECMEREAEELFNDAGDPAEVEDGEE